MSAPGSADRLTERRRADPGTVVAGAVCGLLVAVALLGPLLAPYDPLASNAAAILQPPSAAHWFGTDGIGRDVFSRVLVATRLDLAIAVAAVFASSVLGTALGAFSGYFGGWLDTIVGRCADVILAFPLFVLALALAAALGGGAVSIVIATAVINLPFYIRLSRAEVNARRGLAWVEAARMTGRGPAGVVLACLVPAILPVILVQISINLAWAILNAAGLSFLGLGVQPPTPEWGTMIAEGGRYLLSGHWWLVVFPGLALAAASVAFMVLADGLRDRLDPRGGHG